MSDFLTFLNTADLGTLNGIPGINPRLAAGIIAARPFDFVEDCLHVKGMSKNLLGRVQSHFERELNDSSSRPLLPHDAEAVGPEDSADPRPSFQSRLAEAFANILRSMVRLLITLAVIVIGGTALYYGLPYINEKFMAPVDQNSAQIDRLEAEISTLQTKVEVLDGQLAALQVSVDAETATLDRLKVMQSTLEKTLQENDDHVLLELKHEILMTRALDTIGRGRLYLTQGNFGSASADVRSARDLLLELQSEPQDPVLEDAIAHLDQALSDLPAAPAIAAEELEKAWQLLVTGEASAPGSPLSTPASTPTPAATPTATP